jgi:RNA polymerase sigma-70 factor (ECF subfamily)
LRNQRVSYNSELELVKEASKGNLWAFREIVEKYETMVARVITGMLGNRMDAEDVGQEVFIRFYNSIHQFKGDASIGTYLTRIAINLSLNELKKRKRQSWLSYEDKIKSGETITDETETMETTELVNKALGRLEPEFRSVVVLRLIQGYSTKETAGILGIPVGTALSRLSRAQDKLKGILQVMGVEQP